MKQLFTIVGFLLAAYSINAQTDEVNLQKYWKLRNEFRENFVKIGPDDGESLVMRSAHPMDCIDNVQNLGVGYGQLSWGDGMIRHGYYLGLLATEYYLLKQANEDTKGVLNELYYALNAINRIDFKAERLQSPFYGFNQNESLNGFYMREDIPEDFATQHWGTSKWNARCVDSPNYYNNNVAKVNDPDNHYVVTGNTYQNVPSADQFSALLLGFRLIHKLVDDIYVQPTSADPGFGIVSETQHIVERMVGYINDRNWTMIDVNGWPVTNGGGDCILAAYPISLAAKIITTKDYTANIVRRTGWFSLKDVQYCLTGFVVKDPGYTSQQACNHVHERALETGGTFPAGEAAARVLLNDAVPAGPDNNQDESRYQTWLKNGDIRLPYDFSSLIWGDASQNFINDVYLTDKKLQVLPPPLNLIPWDFIPDGVLDQAPFIVISNYGVASGLWNGTEAAKFADATGNYQLELMNGVLTGRELANPPTFYKNYLDGMEMTGPYNLTELGGVIYARAKNGWASENRWTWGLDKNGTQNSLGIFNGMDYMLFHNLYRILFSSSVPFKPSDECFCGDSPEVSSGAGYYHDRLVQKTQFISYCTPNAFEPTANTVSGPFSIQTLFPEYDAMAIHVPKFETKNTVITASGDVHVKTRFIICNSSTLQIKPGGKFTIEKAVTIANSGATSTDPGSTIDNSGTIRVQTGTQLIIKSGATLILRNGSTLIVEGGAEVIIEAGGKLTQESGSKLQVLSNGKVTINGRMTLNSGSNVTIGTPAIIRIEVGATLDYYANAVINTEGDGSYLGILGTLSVRKNATFQIGYNPGSPTGLVVFEGTPVITAEQGAKFFFKSATNTDPIVDVRANTYVNFTDTDIESIRFETCAIVMNDVSSHMRFEQPITTSYAKFVGGGTIGSQVEVTDANRFVRTEFISVSLLADLAIEQKDKLNLYNCDFTRTATTEGSGISVYGMGYHIADCHFKSIYNFATIESQGMTMNSDISNSTFESPSDISGITAISDFSNTQISVGSCTFTSSAIQKSTGTLLLRCNTFTKSYNNDISVTDGCLLNMSIAAHGGYNVFNPLKGTAPARSHIFLKNADINLTNGSNYFSDVPVAGGLIKGSLATPCANPCTIDFINNQWRDFPFQLFGPSNLNRFAITNTSGAPVNVQTTLAAPKTNCGQLDVVTGVVGYATAVIAGVGNGPLPGLIQNVPKYFSQILGRNVRVDEGIQQAMSFMTSLNDGVGNDLLAVEYFNELFTSTINRAGTTTQKLLGLAQVQMKTALASAISAGQITPAQNEGAFERHVEMYVKAIGTMTTTITADNYRSQFYNELNKAHVLRIIGQPKKSLQILKHAESCKLDASEQAVVNREKKYALYDIQVGALGALAPDTVIVIDSSGFTRPAPFSGPYHFGAQINSLDDILYPGCNTEKMLAGDPENESMAHDIAVYPNPAMREVNIDLTHDQVDGNSVLTFFQSDGRLVQTMEVKSTENRILKLDISQWTPGTYQYKYTRPDGVVTIGKLVVQ